MGATSSQGTGPGMSNGLQKPENNSGCFCSNKSTPTEPATPPKRGCVINVQGGSSVSIQTGGSVGIQVC